MKFTAFILCMLSVIVHYYDYYIIGLFADIVAKEFFPNFTKEYQLYYTYLLISVTYISKPVGALILGMIGDKYGRNTSINISLFCSAFSSLIIYLLPGYNVIGNLSIFILTFARMLICAMTSSGTDGIRIYVFEKIPDNHKNLGIGLVSSSTMMAFFFANYIAYILNTYEYINYSWKSAFLLGFFMAIMLFVIRLLIYTNKEEYVKNDPYYEKYKNINLIKIVKENYSLFLICALVAGSIGSINQFFLIFYGNYMFDILEITDKNNMRLYMLIASSLYMIFSIISGLLSDYFGKKIIHQLSTIILIIISFINCLYINEQKFIPLLYLMSAILLPLILIPSIGTFKSSIPVAIRYRITSIAHAFGSIIISGPTNLIATKIYFSSKISYFPILYFVLIIILLQLAIYLLNKHNKINFKIYD